MSKIYGIDLEATGKDPDYAEIVQLGLVATNFATGKHSILMNSKCKPTSGVIDEGASAVHGLFIENLKYEPLDSVVTQILKLILDDITDNITILTYNGEHFDLPILQRYGVQTSHLPNIDMYRVVQRHWHHHGLKLGEVYKSVTGRDLEGSHDAIPDILATTRLLEIFLIETGKTIGQLVHELSKPVVLDMCFFGKHVGKPFSAVPTGYLYWMKKNMTGLSVDVKATLEHYL